MNSQTVGLVLCALLLNTSGHGLMDVRAKFPFAFRDSAPVNTSGSGGGLYIGIVNSQFLAVYDAARTVVLALEIMNRTAITVDYSPYPSVYAVILLLNSEGVLIETTTLWQPADSDSVQAQIQKVLAILSDGDISSGTVDDVVSMYNQFPVITNQFQFVESGEVLAKGYHLNKLFQTIVGISNLLRNDDLRNGLEAKGAIIPLSVIFEATSAFDTTSNTLGLLDAPALIQILSSFTTTKQFIAFFSTVTGGNNDGLNGFLNVLKAIIFFIHNDLGFQDLVTALNIYFTSEKDNTLAQEWKANIDDLLDLIVQLNIQDQAPFVYFQLQLIQKQLWIENGIDVSAITQTLFTISNTGCYQSTFINVLKLLVVDFPLDRTTHVTGFNKLPKLP